MSYIGRALEAAGILPHTFPYELALKLGFYCGLIWLSGDLHEFDDLDSVDRYLAKLNFTRSDLVYGTLTPKEWLARMKLALSNEGRDVPNWFELGHALFAATWTCADEGAKLEVASGYPIQQEEARDAIRYNENIRKSVPRFLEAYMACGHSPDEAESFFVNKIVPCMWDEGHRKWVNTHHSPALLDLCFVARAKDKYLHDFYRDRIVGTSRAAIEVIPIIGKPLAKLIFG